MMIRRFKTRLFQTTTASLCSLALLACGGADENVASPAQPEATAPATADPAAAPPAPSSLQLCEDLFTRQRDCTDVFIPALVAARVEADVPAGIAALDAEEGRDALIAKAMEEWQVDSQPESIAATCQNIDAKVPPAQKEQLAAAASECMAKATCEAFTECVLPIISSQWQQGQ